MKRSSVVEVIVAFTFSIFSANAVKQQDVGGPTIRSLRAQISRNVQDENQTYVLDSLNDMFAYESSAAGVMFDVVAKDDVVIVKLNLRLGVGAIDDAEIWTRDGSWEGFDKSHHQWQMNGCSTIRYIEDSGSVTFPPEQMDWIYIKAGERKAFYVTVKTGTVAYSSVDMVTNNYFIETGQVARETDHLQMMYGAGKLFRFQGEAFMNRLWNGSITYLIGSPSRPTGDLHMDHNCRFSWSPSLLPTLSPSFSNAPSVLPTAASSIQPTVSPSISLSIFPTTYPSVIPSEQPSSAPSLSPSLLPTLHPSTFLSLIPTESPSDKPSITPTTFPSLLPSADPSIVLTSKPTNSTTLLPSVQPTINPTKVPSFEPSLEPSRNPSRKPSFLPSVNPSVQYTGLPFHTPTAIPSKDPTKWPSTMPSYIPTIDPTHIPSRSPSTTPSTTPTTLPTSTPSSIVSLNVYNAAAIAAAVGAASGAGAVSSLSATSGEQEGEYNDAEDIEAEAEEVDKKEKKKARTKQGSALSSTQTNHVVEAQIGAVDTTTSKYKPEMSSIRENNVGAVLAATTAATIATAVATNKSRQSGKSFKKTTFVNRGYNLEEYRDYSKTDPQLFSSSYHSIKDTYKHDYNDNQRKSSDSDCGERAQRNGINQHQPLPVRSSDFETLPHPVTGYVKSTSRIKDVYSNAPRHSISKPNTFGQGSYRSRSSAEKKRCLKISRNTEHRLKSRNTSTQKQRRGYRKKHWLDDILKDSTIDQSSTSTNLSLKRFHRWDISFPVNNSYSRASIQSRLRETIESIDSEKNRRHHIQQTKSVNDFLVSDGRIRNGYPYTHKLQRDEKSGIRTRITSKYSQKDRQEAKSNNSLLFARTDKYGYSVCD